jgi:hypothetical protein
MYVFHNLIIFQTNMKAKMLFILEYPKNITFYIEQISFIQHGTNIVQ